MDDKNLRSRRQMLSLGAAAGAVTFLQSPKIAQAAEHEHRPDHREINVKDFGAIGNASTDDTAAFQHALDSAHKAGGGTVYAPPGKFLFKGNLTIPDGVTLRGSFNCVPSHAGLRDQGQPKPGEDGTALFVTSGRGHEEGDPFLALATNSSIAGLTIYYPDQAVDANPDPYPWTIGMQGSNSAVLDVELLNPYQGINATRAARHNIRNITGQPLRRGILVDEIYDIGRIENVHFNPWWNSHSQVYKWQTENGEAFLFGRADWEYVLNTFCFGYHVGYKFVETATGECNGNFLGIGADDCYRAILVEQSAPYGILITNGEFTSFHGEDPTMVEVESANKGVVRFSNSAFWGPCNQIAKIDGKGTVGFSECTFVQWGRDGDRAAIQASSGSILLQGCEFRQRKKHVLLGPDVDRAVITGNLFSGPAQIMNSSKGDVQIGLNAASA